MFFISAEYDVARGRVFDSLLGEISNYTVT